MEFSARLLENDDALTSKRSMWSTLPGLLVTTAGMFALDTESRVRRKFVGSLTGAQLLAEFADNGAESGNELEVFKLLIGDAVFLSVAYSFANGAMLGFELIYLILEDWMTAGLLRCNQNDISKVPLSDGSNGSGLLDLLFGWHDLFNC